MRDEKQPSEGEKATMEAMESSPNKFRTDASVDASVAFTSPQNLRKP